MKAIPKIDFNRNKSIQVDGFEIIDLKVLLSNIDNIESHNPNNPHRLNFFAILIITDGEVNHKVDFKTYCLKKDDAILISKGQIHAFEKDNNYHGYLVLFTEEFLHKYIAQSTISEIKHLYNYFLLQKKHNIPEINQNFISSIQNEFNENPKLLANISASILSIYLLKITNNNIDNNRTIDTKKLILFEHFKKLVEENYTISRDAKTYAEKLKISYKHLNDISKVSINDTPKSFIDNFVILEAKRLLVSTNLSAKEIGFSLGFDEPTNFQKFFKKHTKIKPIEFRKKM